MKDKLSKVIKLIETRQKKTDNDDIFLEYYHLLNEIADLDKPFVPGVLYKKHTIHPPTRI